VSNPDDVSSRLSNAIDEILKGAPQTPERDHDSPVESERGNDDPYQLPQIVQATADTPVLPARDRAPSDEPATVPIDPVAVAPVVAAPPAPVPARPPAPAPPAPQAAPATGWSDHLPPTAAHSGQQLRAPGRRPRVRRVTRVVRHIDPWSTFKLALVFSLVGYLVCLTSGVLLWRVADSTGTLDNVERWFTQFGWETFEFDGGEIFHNAWIIGLFAAVGLTGAAVLMATLFNLVSDIVGGIRVTVLEEEVVERTASSARRYVVRRPPLAESSSTSWDVDDGAEATAAVPATPAPPPVATAPPAPAPNWSVDDDEPVTRGSMSAPTQE
jgi:hypothetical protein